MCRIQAYGGLAATIIAAMQCGHFATAETLPPIDTSFVQCDEKHVVKKFHRDRWYNRHWHQRFVGHILWRLHAYGGLAPTALLLCSVDILQQRNRCRRLTLILSSATKWPAGNAAKMLQINIGLPHRRCIRKTLIDLSKTWLHTRKNSCKWYCWHINVCERHDCRQCCCALFPRKHVHISLVCPTVTQIQTTVTVQRQWPPCISRLTKNKICETQISHLLV